MWTGRIERLYSDILTDEIGHVGYCAARCTAVERAVMRRLDPLIGRACLLAKPPRSAFSSTPTEAWRARLDRPFDVNELTAGLDERNVSRHAPVTGRLDLSLKEEASSKSPLLNDSENPPRGLGPAKSRECVDHRRHPRSPGSRPAPPR